MAIYALLDRQRMRSLGRGLPNAPGNFITSRKYAQWYSLTFSPTDKNYIVSIAAKPAYSKAIGYYDNPAPKPAWIPITSSGSLSQINYPTNPVSLPRTPPGGLPSGVNPVIPLSSKAGSQGTIVIRTNPMQLYPTKYPIRRVTILAASTNAAAITTGYDQTITTARGFRLAPGSARDFDIDDLSQLWLVSSNGTDQIDYIFEV